MDEIYKTEILYCDGFETSFSDVQNLKEGLLSLDYFALFYVVRYSLLDVTDVTDRWTVPTEEPKEPTLIVP